MSHAYGDEIKNDILTLTKLCVPVKVFLHAIHASLGAYAHSTALHDASRLDQHSPNAAIMQYDSMQDHHHANHEHTESFSGRHLYQGYTDSVLGPAVSG